MASRTMPNNLEAEMNILGIAFLDAVMATKICEEVSRDVFYETKNQILFDAIFSLNQSQKPLDLMTIRDELDKKKKLNKIGGIDYITEVIDSVVTAANLDYYIEIVKENAMRRNLIKTATDIITEAYQEEDLVTLLDNAERHILNAIKTRQTTEFVSITEVLRRAQANLEQLAKTKQSVTGLRTGFYDLDKITAGFHGGELIILAARPGMGKTALSLNIATNAARATDKAVAIFNLEMSADMLVNRMISAIGQIDGYKLQTGQLLHPDWKRYNEALSQLADLNIYLEDTAGITISEIRAKCRRLANQGKGLGLVVIDYLQLITTGNQRIESRQVEVAEISRCLKTMALELDVPVLALAQLSRSAEKRENAQPMLADLRESGALEQDADLVLFINRQDYYAAKSEKHEKIVPADLIVAKHRKGTTGIINLLFELNMSCFKNFVGSKE